VVELGKEGGMPISHKKKYGIYHWDTFENVTLLVAEANTLAEAEQKVRDKYMGRIRSSGADRVDIVDSIGTVVGVYSIG
jgi:hypothetical protein